MRKIISVIILLFYTQQVLSFSFFQRYKPEELYPISSEYFKQNFKKVKREKIKIPEGVLILPLLDKESKLNSLGTLISILATYKYMYLPEKKLNILMPDLESIFGNNFYKDGKIINFRPKQIKRLMEEMRVNTYVTGFFIHNNKNFHVELRFEGPKGDFNIGREGKIEEIIYIPSWIAENVYKYLGVRISKEKREFMNKLDFYDWRDMVEVASVENLLFKNIYCLTPADDKKLLNTYRKFYLKNPDSIFLIIRYANALWEMHNDKEALDVLERVMKKYPDCERILLCYCHILDSKAYEPCGYDRVIVPILMKLLKTEYLNKNVYSTLIGTYKPYNLWEECETLYNFWVENDPNYYLPYQERGKFYIEYAWYARGGGWAYTVTKEAWRKYFQRLNLAEKDLLKAVSLNPEAYNAYARLVQIGYEMDRSYEYIDYFYKRAIEIQPENVSVYFQKFFKLQPKWGGSLDEMYDFIDELIEKNCKDFIITNLFEIFLNSKFDDKNYYYQKDEIWERIKELFEKLIKKNPDTIYTRYVVLKMAFLRKDYQYAKNILNKLGSYEDNYIFADFEEFIETKKKIIMTLNNVDELGAYKVLIKEYRDWIKKEPDKIFNYIILAYLLNKIKDYKNAEFMISKVEEISMHIPDAYYVKGLIYLDKGEKEKAKECFWRACLTIEHQFSGGVPAIMRFEKYLTWYNKL